MSLAKRIRMILVFAALAAVLLTTGQAGAQTVSWISPGGGAYHYGGNWEGGGIPGTGNDVYFGQPTTYTVTFSEAEMNNRATIRSGEVTFDLNSNTYSLVYGYSFPGSLILGDAAHTDMKLSVLDGRLDIGGAEMATADGSGATLEIGYGGIVGNAKTMYVGYEGEAELRVIEGGKLLKRSNMFTGATLGYNDGSLGIMTVQGAGTEWQAAGSVTVGLFGTGVLSITDGAAATVYGASVNLASIAGSSGTMTVSGGASLTLADRPSSSVGSGSLVVGSTGAGVLTISAGASVTGAQYLKIGNNDSGTSEPSSGTVTITGSGTKVSTENGVHVGNYGNGVLNILAGATSTHDGSGYIAYRPGSTGELTVSGPSSKLAITGVYSALYVGRDYSGNPGGHAVLTVNNGGRVEVDNLLLGPDAHVTVSSLTIGAAPLAMGDKGAAVTADPEGVFTNVVTIAEGAQLSAGSLYINPGGEICGSGAVSADLINEGVIGPGDAINPVNGQLTPAIGTLAVNGNYGQVAGAVLQTDLGAGGTGDLLEASGSAELDGVLELRLFGGYTPTEGDSFVILTATGGVDGEFDEVTCDALDGTDLFADAVYSDNTVVARIAPEPACTCLLLLGSVALLRRRTPRH